MSVCVDDSLTPIAKTKVDGSSDWKEYSLRLNDLKGAKPLYLVWSGEQIEFLKFRFQKED